MATGMFCLFIIVELLIYLEISYLVPAFRINSIWVLSLCIIIFLIEFYSLEGNKFQNSTLSPHILYMYSYREVWTEGRELDLKPSEYNGKILNNANLVFYNILHGQNLLYYWNRSLWIDDVCLIIHESMIWLLIIFILILWFYSWFVALAYTWSSLNIRATVSYSLE